MAFAMVASGIRLVSAAASRYTAVMTHFGIDAIGVAIPRRYLDMGELAVSRGIDPAKYLVGLGAREMAVADPGEDTVSLAATAARRALAAAGLPASELGLLIVGTETGVDHSKPVASFVHGLLELPRHMRVYDTQHACYGGTAGVMSALEWLASGAAAGRSALVICSDIARYGVGTAGEPTQGAGAVAMVLRADPALLALDLGVSGAASSHVHDFWRPLGSREARVDGHYSVQCYLEAIGDASRAWRARAEERGFLSREQPIEQALARICYHVPFCKMARKAHLHVLRCDGEDRGEPPSPAAEAHAAASFAKQVEPSLELCSRVGNVYTGSLYLGLAGLLHRQAAALAGARVGLFSYGSGCTSEFFSGVVSPRAAERIAAARLDDLLAARQRIDVAEYERIMALPAGTPPEELVASGQIRFTGAREDQRQYQLGES